jgi:hypothetical protein
MSPLKTSTAANKRRGGADLARMRQAPTHPGEMFDEEYRKPSGISQAEAARRMGMSTSRLNEIVAAKRRHSGNGGALLSTDWHHSAVLASPAGRL